MNLLNRGKLKIDPQTNMHYLKNNEAILLTSNKSGTVFWLRETKDGDQNLYITLNLSPDELGIIGNECHENGCKSKKSDLMYIHISGTKECVHIFAYEVKTTIGGTDRIENLIEQLNITVRLAEKEIKTYLFYPKLSSISYSVGAFTEKYDKASIENYVDSFDKIKQNAEKMPRTMQKKWLAQNRQKLKRNQVLKSFLNGQIDVNGKLLNMHIHEMHVADDKKAHIYVNFNGSVMHCCT